MRSDGLEKKARAAIALFAIALTLTIVLSLVFFAYNRGQVGSSRIVFYLFSYQIIALIFGLGLIFLLVRWLLRPYRRIVEAAQGSPVHAISARSESEFVVDTFQALIDQLQAKERELAQLHALERKRAEKSERFSERVIANIPSGLVAIDASGLVTSVNAHALRIFSPASLEPGENGATPGEARESDLFPLAVDYRALFQSAPRMVEMIANALRRVSTFARQEVDITRSDGRVRHLGLSISTITDASHNVEGALCLMTDITEVIELRERMKLQENLANLGEMAAGLAHEFKNSLAAIQGYIQLSQAQAVAVAAPDKIGSSLELTLNEVRLLTRLVTDFLNFSRPQQLSMSRLSLRSMMDDCVEELRPLLRQNDAEFTVEGEFPDIVGDESLLKRAFVNLLRNATEALDPHSGLNRIEVQGSAEPGLNGGWAHIRICDTGRGISLEDMPRIFIPFFTTKSRGYGIGLAIVQKIIVAHGGNVSVEKSDSSGTTFHCKLPLAPATYVDLPFEVV